MENCQICSGIPAFWLAVFASKALVVSFYVDSFIFSAYSNTIVFIMEDAVTWLTTA